MGEIRCHKPPASNLGILGSFEQLDHVTTFGFLERFDGSIKTEGWTGNEKIVVVYLLSLVPLFMTPWNIVCQAPLSMGFPRQEYWSGLPFPSPGDLPDPGTELTTPALAGRFFTPEPLEKPT